MAVGVILARGGSARLPGKNLRPLANVPLLDWTVRAGLAAGLDRIMVSSDDKAILAAADRLDQLAPGRVLALERSERYARAWSSDLGALRELMSRLDADEVVVHLRCTAPFVRAEDIRAVVAMLTEKGSPEWSVRSVRPAREHPAKMYRGYLRAGATVLEAILVPWLVPARANHASQWLDPAYLAVGYCDATFAESLWSAGRFDADYILPFFPSEERCLDIDTEDDLAVAERHAEQHGWWPEEVV